MPSVPPPEPNEEEKLEKLPEDEDTPFSAPIDQPESQATTDDPALDDRQDDQEFYDEGTKGLVEDQDDTASNEKGLKL